jgi:hypothetical protein
MLYPSERLLHIATYRWHFRVSYNGGMGDLPRHEFDMGWISPHQLEILENKFMVLKI